jgi:drug/metabolite transporter (DMT)-like permease
MGQDMKHNDGNKKPLPPYMIMIPTVFDIGETMCSNIALTMIAASITQMLRATLIIFTAIFSVLILKMKLYKHHYFSLGLIVIGLVLVSLSQVFEPKKNPNQEADPETNMIVGIIVLLIG